ncbi:MAG TPA: CNNM domain-containing protein, partial [Candidatus Saccharimonadales bacterium]|nr:CNNM domain-containing protein [Candidatus Saccharimonadales bacterium]
MSIFILLLEVLVLVLFSAACSGLNVALMSLDVGDLRRKAKLGSRQARRVLPLRRNAHLSLAAILLTNVAAVSATSLVLDHAIGNGNHALDGVIAGLISTLLIVVFGEIIPQALFARNALAWCSRLAPVLGLMITFTFPVSKPLQILLDKLFPRPGAKLQTRDELGLLISEHLTDKTSELDEDEVEIIRGALQLSEKRVRDIMTDIQHVYWLAPDMPLTESRIDEMKSHGFSRIPVFDHNLSRCYGLLLMKDLVDVDFYGREYTVEDMLLHPVQLVGSMTALDTMFRRFISSGTHLIPVEKDDNIVGIITIEDLIEEIVGHEIEDETDR